MNFHLTSLGCSKNTADSEVIAHRLMQIGWRMVPSEVNAQVCLVNTCGFITDAKKESLKAIMELIKLKNRNPEMKLVVFGCMVKRYQVELRTEIPEVDLFFEFFDETAMQKLQSITGREFTEKQLKAHDKCGSLFTPRHIGILKIAEGCDNRCSYCAIPDIRGPFRSIDLDELIITAENMAQNGVKELSIVAQDTTRYGTDIAKKCLLPELLGKLSSISGPEWIRVHYLHPARLSRTLISDIFSVPKVQAYFDIPFQHSSDRILTLMQRHCSRSKLISLLEDIRSSFANAIVRSTFIVGFPGETEDEFHDLLDFIEQYPIDRLGAFAYSTEEGTPAAKLPGKIPKRIKTRRLDELMTLQQVLAAEYNAKLVGKTLKVIIDRIDERTALGRTYGDAFEVDNSVILEYDGSFESGAIVNVKITAAEAYDLKGSVYP